MRAERRETEMECVRMHIRSLQTCNIWEGFIILMPYKDEIGLNYLDTQRNNELLLSLVFKWTPKNYLDPNSIQIQILLYRSLRFLWMHPTVSILYYIYRLCWDGIELEYRKPIWLSPKNFRILSETCPRYLKSEFEFSCKPSGDEWKQES